MFRRRSKLQRRDRESGLIFSWRVPLTSTASFLVAVIIVGLATAAIAAFVRIRIGVRIENEDRRGTLVLVSEEVGGAWMEAHAVEAGPYPFVWNPAADPAYSALRGEALREAAGGGLPFRPKMLTIEPGPDRRHRDLLGGLMRLPPLPASETGTAPVQARETTLGARVIRSGKGPTLQLPRLPLEAKDAVAASGRRFMVSYGSDGRVREVTPLDPEETPADLVGWISRARVLGNGGTGGWLVAESTVEP